MHIGGAKETAQRANLSQRRKILTRKLMCVWIDTRGLRPVLLSCIKNICPHFQPCQKRPGGSVQVSFDSPTTTWSVRVSFDSSPTTTHSDSRASVVSQRLPYSRGRPLPSAFLVPSPQPSLGRLEAVSTEAVSFQLPPSLPPSLPSGRSRQACRGQASG